MVRKMNAERRRAAARLNKKKCEDLHKSAKEYKVGLALDLTLAHARLKEWEKVDELCGNVLDTVTVKRAKDQKLGIVIGRGNCVASLRPGFVGDLRVNDTVTAVQGEKLGSQKLQEVLKAHEGLQEIELTVTRGAKGGLGLCMMIIVALFGIVLSLAFTAMIVGPPSMPGLDPEGPVAHLEIMRQRMLADPKHMGFLEEKRPEWYALVQGNVDGSFDTEGFRQMLRDERLHARKAFAYKLQDDGSAVNVTAFREQALADPKWMEAMKQQDVNTFYTFKDGKDEDVQGVLRMWKVAHEQPPPPPPPPATPFDEMGQVISTMGIQTDEGEFKELFMMQPEVTEDERWRLPPHMRCDACHAIAHQGALAIQAALAKTNPDHLQVSLLTLEAIDELCKNTTLWTYSYGISSGKKGVNLLTGDGISKSDDSLDGNLEVMAQTQHNGETGSKLSGMCASVLSGGDTEEEAIAIALTEAEDPVATLRELVCEQPGQDCAVDSADA